VAERPLQQEAVILAAGQSLRAGGFKMAFDLGGVSLLGWNIELFSRCCNRITVVGGHKIDRIKALLKDYPKVRLVDNRDYKRGMFSSVLAGAADIEGDCFICPGDYPSIQYDTLKTLLEGEGAVRLPVYKGKKGHPVWLNSSEMDLLRRQDSCYNLRDFIEERGYFPVPVEDGGVLFDIDYKGDYQRFLKGESYEKQSSC